MPHFFCLYLLLFHRLYLFDFLVFATAIAIVVSGYIATNYSLLQNFAARNLKCCFVFRRFRLAMFLVAGVFLLANDKSAYEPI